jgi:hypothetical protein
LALIGLLFALWFFVIRDEQEEEPAEGDVEFDTETDMGDEEFSTEMDEPASQYQSQDVDDLFADNFVRSDVFVNDDEEMTMGI